MKIVAALVLRLYIQRHGSFNILARRGGRDSIRIYFKECEPLLFRTISANGRIFNIVYSPIFVIKEPLVCWNHIIYMARIQWLQSVKIYSELRRLRIQVFGTSRTRRSRCGPDDWLTTCLYEEGGIWALT
jgi:hypothetical protein